MRYQDFDGQWTNAATGEDIGQEKTKSVSGVLEWKPNADFRVRGRASYDEGRDGLRPFVFQDASYNNCYPGTRSIAYYAQSGSNNNNQYYCGTIGPGTVALNSTQRVINPSYIPALPLSLNQTSYDPAPAIAYAGVARNTRVFTLLADWDIFGSGYNLHLDGMKRGEDLKTGNDSEFTTVNIMPVRPAPGTIAYQIFNNDEGTGANTALDQTQDYSVEVKLESPADRDVRWMLGGFYYKQDHQNTDVNFAYPEGRIGANNTDRQRNKSVFALVDWKFAEGWNVTAEGRYMKETKGLTNWCTSATLAAPSACPPQTGLTLLDGPGTVITFDGEGSWTKFTPRVTLKWQVNPDLNLYAIYAEGIKPGGLNGATGLVVSPPQVTFEPETSKNYELGMKSLWLDGKLMFNVAAFFNQADGIQLTTPIYRTDGSPITSLVTNQGNGETKGVEVEARWRIADPLTLSVTYALADTKFTEGCDDFQWTLTSGGGNSVGRQGAYNPANPAAGGTNLNGKGNCSIVGNPYPLSAKNTGSIALDFRQPFGDGYEFFTNLDASYTDKRPAQVHANPWVGSATLLGAHMGVSTETWSVAVYGKNLTNEDSLYVATRWFMSTMAPQNRTAASLTAAGLPVYPGVPGSTLPPYNLPAATGLNSVASYTLPRAFWGMLRRERQVGVEFTYHFGGQ
jgi:outer membrane receptor protein involved in Fe transport